MHLRSCLNDERMLRSRENPERLLKRGGASEGRNSTAPAMQRLKHLTQTHEPALSRFSPDCLLLPAQTQVGEALGPPNLWSTAWEGQDMGRIINLCRRLKRHRGLINLDHAELKNGILGLI